MTPLTPHRAQFSTTEINIFLLVPGLAATAAVALRFYARYLKKSMRWWDDWLVVASLIFYWCFVAIGLYGKIYEVYASFR